MSRVETGVLQVGDDWPGVFIRGDNALMGYAPALRTVLHYFSIDKDDENCFEKMMSKAQVESLLKLLESCAASPDKEGQKIVDGILFKGKLI